MALYEFEGKRPRIGAGSFIPESADVIGDVTIGEKCFIGGGARTRGDYGTIVIGNGTSVQENVVTHAREGDRTVVGQVTDEHQQEWLHYKRLYALLASERYPRGLRRIG